MKVEINKIFGQIHLLPSFKITHDKWLNSRYELILCFLKWEFVFCE